MVAMTVMAVTAVLKLCVSKEVSGGIKRKRTRVKWDSNFKRKLTDSGDGLWILSEICGEFMEVAGS